MPVALILRLAPWVLGAVFIAALGWKTYGLGYAASEGRHLAALAQARQEAARAADLASRIEADRLALQSQRDAIARELEDAANEDPDADRPALGAGSVQRINRR